MSFYGTRNNSTSDRLPRNRTSYRKDSVPDRGDQNTNGNNNNNNNEVSKGIESYISNYTRNAGSSNRSSTSRMPGGLRMKSNLVGSMTATFEQLKIKDTLPPPGSPVLKSPSYTRFESTSVTATKSVSSSKLENGNAHKNAVDNSAKKENGIVTKKKNEADNNDDDEDFEKVSSARSAKPSSSARRGKQQREKRMLRQKRRSTGVVRLKGSDDEDGEKPKENDEKEEEVNRKSETEKNTLSNELSPPPSSNSSRVDSANQPKPYDVQDSSILKKTSNSSSLLSPSLPDNVFLSGESAPQSPDVPSLNSSRRRGKRNSDIKSPSESNDKSTIEELRQKLNAAELTIANLKKELSEKDVELDSLKMENKNLKKEKKLLDDENTSMIMILRQIRSKTERET